MTDVEAQQQHEATRHCGERLKWYFIILAILMFVFVAIFLYKGFAKVSTVDATNY